MSEVVSDLLDQVEKHLSPAGQIWLLGAGVSYNAGVPLMSQLTSRVRQLVAEAEQQNLLADILAVLKPGSHIEHVLSYLSDQITVAGRTVLETASINGRQYKVADLVALHAAVLTHISRVVRWGFRAATDASPEEVGSASDPIITIADHLAFMDALFNRAQAGLQRGPIKIFTTNYDTLIEDALALSGVSYWDGFSGGAVAFRTHSFGGKEPGAEVKAHVVKLHGSIDWRLVASQRVVRVRDSDAYPEKGGLALIYPQATKYVATQRDPFAAQFEQLRRALSASNVVMGICGYSFGDEHINDEIALAMSAPNNNVTLIAFVDELPHVLREWLETGWGSRVYALTRTGVFNGSAANKVVPSGNYSWWTFSGLTSALRDGLGGKVG